MGRHRMVFNLRKQLSVVLVVEFAEKWMSPIVKNLPRVYMKAMGMVKFNSFLVIRGSTSKVDV